MFTLRFILRNLSRNKLRNALTVLGMVVSILAFGMLRTVIDAWYAGVDAAAANRLVTRNAISLIYSLPLAYKERIRQTPGVSGVSFGNWFGGVYVDEKNFFANFAVQAASYLDLYPEYVLPPGQKAAFLRERKACVAGRKLMARFGWKVGDTITLKGTIFPGDWDMTLVGAYHGDRPGVDETQLFFHWDYLNESLVKSGGSEANRVGFYIVAVKDPGQAAEVSRSVDALFRNSPAETLTETEKAFQLSFIAMSDAIIAAIRFVSLVVIVIILAVAANTMAMSVRERTREYAVLRVMGFGGGYTAALILGESMALSLAGGVLGILADFPLAAFFGRAMSEFFPIFRVSASTLVMQACAAAAVGAVAAVVPAFRAAGVRPAEGLRGAG